MDVKGGLAECSGWSVEEQEGGVMLKGGRFGTTGRKTGVIGVDEGEDCL